MTLDELETFVCIVESGGFTEASRRLHRSQPAISRRIRELEDSLSAVLFERTGRRMVLTDAGRAMLPYAQAALAAVRDTERAVRDQAPGPMELTIAIVGTLADSHIVDCLRAFTARFADATVNLRTAGSGEVSALVRSGEAGLGLRYFADPNPKLESIPIGAEQMFVVLPAAHPITAYQLPDLRTLGGERWLCFAPQRGRPDSYHSLLQQQFAASGVSDASITMVDSLTAQKRLIQAGFGVALMPNSSVREELRVGSLRAIELTALNPRLPVVAIRRAGGYRSRAADTFLQVLTEHTPDLFQSRADAV